MHQIMNIINSLIYVLPTDTLFLLIFDFSSIIAVTDSSTFECFQLNVLLHSIWTQTFVNYRNYLQSHLRETTWKLNY